MPLVFGKEKENEAAFCLQPVLYVQRYSGISNMGAPVLLFLRPEPQYAG